jgi:hypothetical protein
MATYYVRPDGNDSNTGLGSTTILAWKTLQKALSATGISSGDTVYIAPGRYNEAVTVAMTSATTTTRIVGDPTASQFSGVSAGEVLWTGFTSTGVKSINFLLSMTSKNYLSFENIHFEATYGGGASACINCLTSTNISFIRCQFTEPIIGNTFLRITSPSSTALNATIDSCHFFYNQNSSGPGSSLIGQNVTDNTVVKNCIIMCHRSNSCNVTNLQCKAHNNTFIGSGTGFENAGGSASFQTIVRNSLFIGCVYGLYSSTTSTVVEDYNRYIGVTNTVTNAVSGGNSSTLGGFGIFGSYALQQGLVFGQMLGTNQSSPNTSFGNATGAPTTDMFGIAWSGTSPDAGSATLRSIGAIGNYLPTERNASTITIAPGSTSQSIELYLGSTGLTASTSGLSARYNRTRTASVGIPLVARTIAQAWTAGGFAEVDSTNMPGVYRLDLPDAALAAGGDDVTVVVRGASGTNGAVMTVKLSSGGLTSAQTASAVWGASPAGYNDGTTFGGVVNETNQLANSLDTQVQDVPSNVWEEMRATHTTAGTFGEYVNAELVTPVTSAALVRMGPYEVKADGLGASDPLDIQKGAQHGVDIQCVDGNGNGIDITSATVTAKVYNSGGSLVDTYSCTATYAADGRATFTIDTTVTNTPGTYTATITRTTGASDTQVFGPLRIYVRDI